MKTKELKFLLIASVVAISTSCTENDTSGPGQTPPDPDSVDVPLSADQIAFLETLPDTIIQLKDIAFEDGMNARTLLETYDPAFLSAYPSGRSDRTQVFSPHLQKQMFLSRMFAMGNYLVDDYYHTYSSDGAESPAQTGLAYSWGSKDYNIRQFPPVSNGCMTKKLYGLDCTGMLWAMTESANLSVAPRFNFFVRYLSNAQLWTNAFKASSDYKDLEMKDMGQIPERMMKNGDIIFWPSHVGVYLRGKFYQSNGSSDGRSCDANISASRGPRAISLAEVLTYGLGPFKVFRVIHVHNFALRIENKHPFLGCGYDGQYFDAVDVIFHIDKDHTVTIDNIINQVPTITPSVKDVNGCTITCLPGSTGELNVTEGSGEVEPIPHSNGNYHFTLTLENKNLGAGYLYTAQCPGADPESFAGQPYDYTSIFGFVLADSIQTPIPLSPAITLVKLEPN